MDILNKELKIDRKFIIMLVIFNFLIIGIYYTYSIFVVKQIKDDISLISVKGNFLTMSSTSLTNNAITVAANTSQDVTIDLTNPTNALLYYRIMHEGVPTGVAVYEKNGDNTSWGPLESSDSISSIISVSNTTDSDVTIVFKCQESTSQYFDKEIGDSFVNTSLNFDHSGAYSPYDEEWSDSDSLDYNMIPVYYEATSATAGVWKIANRANNDSEHIWYDYDNHMWANAVTVTEANRATYLAATPGTEVVLSDINSFYVWIPQYKYYVVSGDGNTSLEKLINVNFVGLRDDIEPSGTVMCEEAISNNEDKHLYSEICYDEKYGDIYNNLSTYYHPSFENSDGGLWVSKFATRNVSNLSILPNSSLSSNYVTSTAIRDMSSEGNIYGFVDASSSMMTSMDWGMVAILTNSSYGKSGNPMYQTDTIKSFTRVYNNASNYYTGRSTYYTTSNTSVSNNNSNTTYYNDLTDVTHTSNSVTYPIGYRGAGASTTGTIYGIYDMAGGTYTTVLGIVMNEDGTAPYNIDNIENYYDYTAYSYIPYNGKIDDASKSGYLEVFRLGDGVKEHVRTFSEKGMWQDGTLTLNNKGIMRRGGYTTSGSLFTTEIVDSNMVYGTFVVIGFYYK